jgi:hypothetical protein
MAAASDKDEGLKRLGGGRWQTRDERFTIEPQSGTWAVVDAEQTDDLGLPLVRGPFKSLGAAKEAIEAARGTAAPTSKLKARAGSAPGAATPAKATKTASGSKASAKGKAETRQPAKPPEPEEPPEPRWLRDLEPAERRRATKLIEQLAKAGAADPEGMVRRDLIGEVPAVAGFALEQAIKALGAKPSLAEVADLLVDGRDNALGVRWRLVDGDGRPIPLDTDAIG